MEHNATRSTAKVTLEKKKEKKERNTAKITVDKSRFKQSYQQQKYMKLIEKKCVTTNCGNNVASALSVIVTDSKCRQGEHCVYWTIPLA